MKPATRYKTEPVCCSCGSEPERASIFGEDTYCAECRPDWLGKMRKAIEALDFCVYWIEDECEGEDIPPLVLKARALLARIEVGGAMTKNDGGPAFPVSDDAADMPGLSLRDWFAGMVLPQIYYANHDISDAKMALMAYELADAMLKEREK